METRHKREGERGRERERKGERKKERERDRDREREREREREKKNLQILKLNETLSTPLPSNTANEYRIKFRFSLILSSAYAFGDDINFADLQILHISIFA